MKTHAKRMIKSHCPNCGRVLDSATAVSSDAIEPKPGDLTICFYCAQILVFADDLTLRDLTLEEMALAAKDKGVMRAQATVFEFLRGKRS